MTTETLERDTTASDKERADTLQSFAELNLAEPLLRALATMGFEKPSSIQSHAIPILLQGKDVIGQAQTGSGKTAAFAIPVIQSLDTTSSDVQALILCPTRELCLQVAGQVEQLLQFTKGLSVVSVYGGEDIRRQLRSLKQRPAIVVGTPGRTMDLMERQALDISAVRTVVLDEADEMLDMGFRDDMETILSEAIYPGRQTVLFSATMESSILKLAKTFQQNPVVIDVSDQQRSQPKIDQFFSLVPDAYKSEATFRLLVANDVQCAVVFCNTKARVEEVVEYLRGKNIRADALHGDLNQNARTRIMQAFKAGYFHVLVATDVAGRGMDVNNLEVVINYDLPRDNEDYVHRVGRTGRAGKSGKAYTLVNHKQAFIMKKIARTYNLTIQPLPIPTSEVIQRMHLQRLTTQLQARLQPETKEALVPYINQLKRLSSAGIEPMEIAAALLAEIHEKNQQLADPHLDKVFTIDPRPAYGDRGPRRERFGESASGGYRKPGSGGQRQRYGSDDRSSRQERFGGKKEGRSTWKPDQGGSYRSSKPKPY